MMDISDWLEDDILYCLPDGVIVRATFEERDDAFRWVLRDRAGQRLFVFMDDGRVRAYVREEAHLDEILPPGSPRPVRISMVPCDLTLADLRCYSGPS